MSADLFGVASDRGLLIVIGAMRCGTTTLHRYFSGHPDVRASKDKEVHYFDRNFALGDSWYRDQFAAGPTGSWLADVTPAYMYDPAACGRMAARNDVGKLVVVLRDPVTRAFSHYLLTRSYGKESLTFAEALEQESERIQRSEQDRRLYSYVDRGHYLRQLMPYAAAFGRDALHVMITEELSLGQPTAWTQLCTFADIEFRPPLREPPANRYVEFRAPGLRGVIKRVPPLLGRPLGRINARRRRPPLLDPRDHERLRECFEEEVLELSEWLGRDLSVFWS